MKFWRLTIFIIYAAFLIKNANSVGESGERSKLYKSFDEIFGKGWDAEVPEFTETKEWHKMETQTTEVENKSTNQPNPNEQSFSDHYESFVNRKIRERFDEIYDENWSEDDNEFIEEDEAYSTDQNDADGQKCQKMQENGTKLIKSRKNFSDQQKREIVEKFISLTEKYKQKGKHSRKEWNKYYIKISKSVGAGYSTIKNWKKKFGLSQITQQNDYSDQQKREIVEEFITKKNEYKQKRKYSHKEWDKNYTKISKSVGVGHNTIKKWKKEFGLSIKFHSKQEKIKKLKQYCEIKKGNPKISDFEIAESLNIGGSTLGQWKREIKNAVKDDNNCPLQKECDQISPYKVYSDQQKREILKQFEKIKSKCKKAKLKNILMRELDDKIAKKLGVCRRTIIEWKRKFGLSVCNKTFSEATKIGILTKYVKIREKNPKMSDCDIVDLLKISISSLKRWKAQFSEENNHL